MPIAVLNLADCNATEPALLHVDQSTTLGVTGQPAPSLATITLAIAAADCFVVCRLSKVAIYGNISLVKPDTGSSVPPSVPEGAESAFRDLPVRTKFKEMVREIGPGWVALGLLTLPLACACIGIGTIGRVHWLVIVGVGLLVVGLVEKSILWPIRRARLAARHRSAK